VPEPDNSVPAEPYAEFTLQGDRFADGRLPVDALAEIQRYKELLLAAAKRAWLADHPKAEEVPDDFDLEFDLAITNVSRGSMHATLERSDSTYGTYLDEAVPTVDRLFEKIITGFQPTELDGGNGILGEEERDVVRDLATTKAFRDFGRDLEPDDSVVFGPPAPDAPRFTMGTRAKNLRPVAKKARQLEKGRLHLDTTIAGRLIALNADRQSYTINSLAFGERNGRYADPELTAELRSYLDSSEQAPIIRVTGHMSFSNGRLERILNANQIELFEVATEPWSRRVVELLSLPPDWSEDQANSETISIAALDAGRELIRRVVSAVDISPAISPLEDGGVHLQWHLGNLAVSVEVDHSQLFSAQSLRVSNLGEDNEERASRYLETLNLDEAAEFVTGAMR
jgi:hypothetical protein